MDKIALGHLEVLNQLKLNDAQKDEVLSFFAKREVEFAALDTIDTSNTAPMVQVMPMPLSLREDEIKQPFSRQDLQAQAPATDAGYFCVPRVIE